MEYMEACMRGLLQDMRFAVRQLRRAPGFALTALLTLALGIGSVVSVFSVVYSVLLRPYGFEQQGKLVVWHEVIEELKASTPIVPANYKHYAMFKAQGHSLADAAIMQPQQFSVSPDARGGDVHPSVMHGLATSSELFSVLGIQPALGRSFLPRETERGRDGEAMLAWAAWQRLFHGDPAAIGKSIRIDGKLRTVIGILPRDFRLPPLDMMGEPSASGSTEFYQVFVPLVVDEDIKTADASDYNYLAVGRLRPGVSVATAQAEMNGLEAANAIANHLPIHVSAVVSTLAMEANGGISTALWLLLAATGGVLLIACVNLANLQLARSVARERDVALRSALGAGRIRLMQSALAESVVLALGGGALGVALAFAAVRLTVLLAPRSLPRINEIAISWPVLLVAVGVACSTALLFGILPALASLRVDPQQSLQAASGTFAGTNRGGMTRRMLVGCEIALSVALLATAGLAGRSFSRVMAENWHFSTDHVLLAEVDLTSPQYGKGLNPTAPGATADHSRGVAFVEQALLRLRSLPGVTTVGVTSSMPLTGDSNIEGLILPDHPAPRGMPPVANERLISPGYLKAMQIPLVAGRDFDEREMTHPASAIVSEKAAKAAWPDVNPLGRKIALWNQQFTIVGIAADARTNDLKRNVAVFYVPISANPPRRPIFVIRGNAPPEALTPLVRQALWSIDPEVALPVVEPLAEQVSASMAAERLQAMLFTGFGGAALLLAALGVYGVLAYTVSLRRREFGVRLALGSQRAALVRLVLLEALRPLIFGLAAGLGLAFLAGRWLSSLLYETVGNDPVVLSGSGILLVTAAVVAALLPARRAADTDPMTVLREC
jgi:predicted permease